MSKKQVTAILSGDKHLRDDVPECRTDDYISAQWTKMQFIKSLCVNTAELDAGDLFNRWRPSLELVSRTIDTISGDTYIAPGNHDLPQHNMSMLFKSGLGLLSNIGMVRILSDSICTYDEESFGLTIVPWGMSLPRFDHELAKEVNVLLTHDLVYEGNPPWPGAEKIGHQALSYLKRAVDYDLIVTGHNHKTFVVEHKGRLLVNPGSMMRMTADQMDHKPCVFKWYMADNSVEQVFLPIKEDVISREHIEVKKHKDERIAAFIESLNHDVEIGLSFEQNLERYMKANSIPRFTREIIWEALKK